MKLVSGINTSGIFSHSGLSAEIATKDSLGNVIKDTYLSAVPEGYLTKSSGDTLYQPIGNYASDSDLSYVSGKVDSVSSDLSGAVDYVSANIGDAFTGVNVNIPLTGDGKTSPLGLMSYISWGGNGTTSTFTRSGVRVLDENNNSAYYLASGLNLNNESITDSAISSWNDTKTTVETNSASWGAGSVSLPITGSSNNTTATYDSNSAMFDYSETQGEPTHIKISINPDPNEGYITIYNSSDEDETNNTLTLNDASIVFKDTDGSECIIYKDSITSWDSTYNTVESNSANWLSAIPSSYLQNTDLGLDGNNKVTAISGLEIAGGGGGSIDTLPFFVQEPLTTGISGSSAYIALTGGMDNTAYVPYSAIGYYNSFINTINDSGIYAQYSDNAIYSETARFDFNGNEITSYYQPTLTFGVSDNTITSINNTAVGGGGGTPTATLELSAGNYITITDDTANSASILSVSGLATTTEMNYVSGVIGDVETLLASL